MATQDEIEALKKELRRHGIDLWNIPDGALQAGLEAAERARWQPIETAPKDEDTDILLGCFGEHWYGGRFVAFWDQGSEDKDRHWQTADGPVYHDRLPTHWQPLTSPLTRALDAAMHDEKGAAKQASLCDLIGPAKDMRSEIKWLGKRSDDLQTESNGWKKRAEKAEAERDEANAVAKALNGDVWAIESATTERFKPLLAKIASIPLWRDTYPDGPDMTVQDINTVCPYGLTAEDVRLARAIVKPSGDR